MRPRIAVTTVLAFLLLSSGARGQQPASLGGHLLDAITGRPVEGASVDLTDRAGVGVTDSLGSFRIDSVPPGSHVLRVRHIAYGEHTHDVEVRAGDSLRIELRLSPQALQLDLLEVVAARRSPGRANVITREQIERQAGRARNIGDIVRMHIPGAVVSESPGGYLCVEFRGGASSRTRGCNYPLVIVDGLPIAEAGRFLRDLQVSDIERIEFVPASEGSARYGMGATYGVLVIDTRRSGIVAERQQPASRRFPAYQWSTEPGGHPVFRALGGATAGSIAGTALGLALIGCPPRGGSGPGCIRDAGAGAGLAALLLPIAGSATGARFLGTTQISRGRLLPGLAMSFFPAALGYGIYYEGARSDDTGERVLGAGLILVVTPLVSTLADHLFRNRRQDTARASSGPDPAEPAASSRRGR